ncbi:MAG: tetratricopeptide repeat protein [Candidatus Cryptobacteroides sp.]
MKKVLLALALVASLSVANAQTTGKSPEAAKKAVEKAIEKTENPKQSEKPDTWIKLGKAYIDAYNAPKGAGWIGAQRAELALILGDDQPSKEEWVNLSGADYIKAEFPTRNYYYNENEILQFVEVTQPVFPDALERALAAYKKAAELDAAGKKSKDLKEAFRSLSINFTDEAYLAYTLGDLQRASYFFEKTVESSEQQPYAVVDTNAVYNSALTSYILGDFDKAQSYYEKSLSLGYYGDDGDAFAKLADIATKKGDNEAARNYLEQAFLQFPKSQSVLVGLINYYMNSGENTDRLFDLINAAKENEPNNASLYYVEGNVYLQLGREEEAVNSYSQCATINPDYEFGFIGIGQLYYNKAVTIQEVAANEMDDNKYNALVADFEVALKNCIEPFETAYAVTKDTTIKVAIAEYLRNVYYRFSSEPAYEAKYRHYDAIVKGEVPVE